MHRRLVFVISLLWLTFPSQAQSRETFDGPFASWANIAVRFGAGKGSDDTKAFQQAIDSLSVFQAPTFNTSLPLRFVVIYLPAGTYNLSATLHLNGKIGCSIIGEDPEKTVIRWNGVDKDTMLVANGSSYFKISRITWDGNHKLGMEAIGLHWIDNYGRRFASTSIEFSDMIFRNLSNGISGGTFGNDGTGANDAEVAVKRCRFYDCDNAAIYIKGYNALDYWIWNCYFYHCARGIECALGNYHAYSSAFIRSSIADFDNSGPYYCSVRYCTSYGSQNFSVDRGSSSNPFKRIFEHNIVEAVTDVPIQYYDQGRLTLFGNSFQNSKSSLPFTVNYGGWYNAIYQILSIDNYSEDSFYINHRPDHPFILYSSGDKKAKRGNLSLKAAPTPYAFMEMRKRKIFEVSDTLSSRAVQAIIDKAVKNGGGSIVHFATGIYLFSSSLKIPDHADIQIIGDGLLEATIFRRLNTNDSFPFFEMSGKTQVQLKNFGMQSVNISGVPAIVFSGFDKPGSEVHIDQMYSDANQSLIIKNADETYFQKDNSFHSSGTTLIGGRKTAMGRGRSVLYCFGAQGVKAKLQNNAIMVVKDCWWEGAKKKQFLPIDLSGSGRFSLQGCLLAPGDLDSTATIRINNFSGKVTLADMYVWGGMTATPAPSLKVFVWNVHFMMKEDASSFLHPSDNYPIAMAGISTACAKTQSGTCTDDQIKSPPDIFKNVHDTTAFINEMTADLRTATPRTFRNLPSGVTNVLISRVSVSGGDIAFEFKQD